VPYSIDIGEAVLLFRQSRVCPPLLSSIPELGFLIEHQPLDQEKILSFTEFQKGTELNSVDFLQVERFSCVFVCLVKV
jgi:hypothetical protein